ncbi:hypothetical protein Z043_104909 [Scleropages formosus]|uniref:Uncharacterized protein n=1 Tax=Scleropages formosus TaxID=113540 RepID=A0A0P7UZX9_SCLFO|nr:hypothetical protein Z043_104909 [Scleropages formosus]
MQMKEKGAELDSGRERGHVERPVREASRVRSFSRNRVGLPVHRPKHIFARADLHLKETSAGNSHSHASQHFPGECRYGQDPKNNGRSSEPVHREREPGDFVPCHSIEGPLEERFTCFASGCTAAPGPTHVGRLPKSGLHPFEPKHVYPNGNPPPDLLVEVSTGSRV